MQIPEELLSKWKALRSQDDTEKIAEDAKTTSQTIRNAFNWGKCSDEVFKCMAAYYENKAEVIKQYI